MDNMLDNVTDIDSLLILKTRLVRKHRPSNRALASSGTIGFASRVLSRNVGDTKRSVHNRAAPWATQLWSSENPRSKGLRPPFIQEDFGYIACLTFILLLACLAQS